jgi:hypothetical protein
MKHKRAVESFFFFFALAACFLISLKLDESHEETVWHREVLRAIIESLDLIC